MSLLDAIRAATRHRHQRLERRIAGDGRSWSLRRYGGFLAMSYGVIAPLEQSLSGYLGPVFDVPPPFTRSQRLRADLTALGVDPPETGTRGLASFADALGAGYVIQGSMLGGAVIRNLVRRQGACAVVPASYLDAYGSDLQDAWNRYCGVIQSFGLVADEGDRQRTIETALAAFDWYECAHERVE